MNVSAGVGGVHNAKQNREKFEKCYGNLGVENFENNGNLRAKFYKKQVVERFLISDNSKNFSSVGSVRNVEKNRERLRCDCPQTIFKWKSRQLLIFKQDNGKLDGWTDTKSVATTQHIQHSGFKLNCLVCECLHRKNSANFQRWKNFIKSSQIFAIFGA